MAVPKSLLTFLALIIDRRVVYATFVVVISAKTEGQFMLFVIFQIENRKLDWNTASKIGSLDNAKHKPGGGQVKVRLRNCSESSKHF